MPSTAPTRFTGSSVSVPIVPGAPPRTSTAAAIAFSARTTVTPVRARRSSAWPRRRPSTSVIRLRLPARVIAGNRNAAAHARKGRDELTAARTFLSSGHSVASPAHALRGGGNLWARRFGGIVALLAFFAATPAALARAETPAKHDMIAAANPLAVDAGLAMLREGGSAADAAIAVQMVLTLVEPESSGIGGGAFMLLYDPATRQVTSFDGRETAPASATPGMFLDAGGNPRPKREVIPGGLSVGVPGDVAMLELVHKRYGRLPWAKLFEPAIALASNGFPVGRKLAATIAAQARMARMPDIKAYFYKADGTPLK